MDLFLSACSISSILEKLPGFLSLSQLEISNKYLKLYPDLDNNWLTV